jgi:hypothetical protein
VSKVKWESGESTFFPKVDGEPSVWRTRVGDLQINVHRAVQHVGGGWRLSTWPELFDYHILKSKNVAEAKKEALATVRRRLRGTIKKLGGGRGKT